VIIDSHVHVWPDSIAERALSGPQADLHRFGDGTISGALSAMDDAGVDVAITLNVANVAKHLSKVNSFAGSMEPSRFVGFGTIHPDLSPEENLASLSANGLRGVKIHPLFQGFALDDPRLIAILDALRGDYITVIHVGEGGDAAGNQRATPAMLRALIDALPGLEIIACHFGGYRNLAEAQELILGQDVYLDTSWPPGLASLDPANVCAMVRRHGSDRVVFGSDWPMGQPAVDIATIRGLGLTQEEIDLILGENMSRLLGLSS
jgi:uncharacterized protein